MGGGARTPGRGTIERDATLFPYHLARIIHADRERELREHLRFRAGFDEPRPESPLRIRRRLGRGLVRLGWAIGYDGPLQPSARR